MTLFDPEPYSDPALEARLRRKNVPATSSQRVSDGTWYALSRRSGMVPFAHRLGRLPNKYGSTVTRCGLVCRIVERVTRGTVTNACDRCQTLGNLSQLPEAE